MGKRRWGYKLIFLNIVQLFTNNFMKKLLTGFVRVRLSQAKSVFLKKVEKGKAKLVFLFKILRMLVFVSSNA